MYHSGVKTGKRGENLARVARKALHNKQRYQGGGSLTLKSGCTLATTRNGVAAIFEPANGGEPVVVVTAPRVTYSSHIADAGEGAEALAGYGGNDGSASEGDLLELMLDKALNGDMTIDDVLNMVVKVERVVAIAQRPLLSHFPIAAE
jgi:hypothetical protein